MTLTAIVGVPCDIGKIVSVEWDVYGNNSFIPAEFGVPSPMVRVNTTHVYSEPGVYFLSIRVASYRTGIMESPYALAWMAVRV